jgi:hypothetical protein
MGVTMLRRLALFSALLLSACDSPIDPELQAIGGGLRIRIHEVRGPAGVRAGEFVWFQQQGAPTIALEAEMLRDPGGCYIWPWNVSIAGTSIVVDIGEPAPIYGVCSGAKFPPLRTLALPQNTGRYTLDLIRGASRDRYVYEVTPDAVRVLEEDREFTELESRVAWRFRPNTFMLGCDPSSRRAALCAEAHDRLIAADVASFVFPPNGTVPFLVARTGDARKYMFGAYSYDDPASFRRSGDLLRAAGLGAGFCAVLENWTGEMLHLC